MRMGQSKIQSFTGKFWVVEILVFKTDLCSAERIERVKRELDQISADWNVDVHDCDYVLRVVAQNRQGPSIIRTLSMAGFLCEELI